MTLAPAFAGPQNIDFAAGRPLPSPAKIPAVRDTGLWSRDRPSSSRGETPPGYSTGQARGDLFATVINHYSE